MAITGAFFIGAERVATRETFAATNPADNSALTPGFSISGAEHVQSACALADAVFDAFRESSLEARARFLETIADNIAALGPELIERAELETGLPRARLEGERGRTMGQLRLFANLVRGGDWLGVRVDPALPERTPAPRPDLRQRKIALGPVAVFGASNFPLAFSVAGGDTAAAMAAGCPVVVKAHPAHPGVSELVAGAIVDAVKAAGLPEGVFSMLAGPANALGAALAADPRIKAVAFTGSRAGGLALAKIAQTRAEPIPVYAEMSSINPILLLPHALKARGRELATAFVASLTMGAGQFCTNPGLVLAVAGPDLERFADAAAIGLNGAPPALMLTPRIHQTYIEGVNKLAAQSGVDVLVRGGGDASPNRGRAALFATDAATFLANAELSHEVFGASSLIVRCRDEAEMLRVIAGLEGQLTAALHMDDADQALAGRLLPALERKAGRILANGWPTGVEVSPAMVHGGPCPATTDARGTSVGTLAIERFLRPVCYQNLDDALLPKALRSDNPLGLARLVDGRYEPGKL